MATKHKVPMFKSEREEAAWWDSHPEVITELFMKARRKAGSSDCRWSVGLRNL